MFRDRARQLAVVGGVLSASLMAPAGVASAGEFEASLTTLVSGRQDPRDDQVHTVVPVFVLISVRATEIANPWFDDVKVVVGGWVRLDFGEPADDDLGTGDVNVAYIEGSLLEKRMKLRAGRQLVLGGGARALQHDGLSAAYRVWRGLSVEVYGGHPVTPRFVMERGDAVGGTRVSWRQTADSELGASFIHLRGDGRVDRQDVGLDGRYRIKKKWVASAFGLWSTLENRVAEVNAGVQWRPSRRVQVAADYRLTAPDLFLPRGSILSVFAEDRRQEVGANVSLRPRPRIRVNLDSYLLNLEEGSGARGRGRATLFFGDRFDTRIGAEARFLHVPFNGYQQARVYGGHQATPALRLGVDADVYRFEESINGADWSVTGTASASYRVASKWHATVVGLGGVTPFLERRLEIMGKLTYGQVREVRRQLP